jgi:hypothetical protein
MSDIDRLLTFDPLASAEELTGSSYKEDRGTMALGFLMHLRHSDQKRRALAASGDSWFNMDLAETLSLYSQMGFEEVLCDEFAGRSWGEEPAHRETFRILWHPKGILATVESYQGTRRNSTKIYYNVAISDVASGRWVSCISSGRMAKVGDVYVGDHDAREGVRRAISRWEEVGEFVPAWVDRPFLWLLTYTDSDVEGYDYVAINAERISRLPKHVQAAVGGAS